MRRILLFVFGLGLLMLPQLAKADVVSIDLISDGWTNPVGGDSLYINNVANPGTDIIRWGYGNSSSSSGYDWNSTDTGFPVTTDTLFSLGKFAHVNQPIPSGTSIKSVELDFAVGNFETPLAINATFLFSHDETPNAEPCAYSSTSPCADKVTISNAFFNTPFKDNGGTDYYFTLLGFSTDGGTTISNSFVTQEGQWNYADLYAKITVEPVEVPGVPEPTSLILLGTGLGVLGLAAWRRKK